MKQKPFIPIVRHLRTLGPHGWGAVRTGEQDPCFAGDVHPHKPRGGLCPEQIGARLGDVLGSCLFRLGRGRNTRKLMFAHIAYASLTRALFDYRRAGIGERLVFEPYTRKPLRGRTAGSSTGRYSM